MADRTVAASAEIEMAKLVEDMPVLIKRLQTEYTRYLSGAEKKPPVFLRGQLDKSARRARTLMRECQNKALKFKAQDILSRVDLYTVMWDRKLAALERTRSK